MVSGSNSNGDDDVWRTLGALEAQGEERTKQIERLFVILGDVKYESSKIAACVESLTEQFRHHMLDEARDFDTVVKRVKENEEKCTTHCSKLDAATNLFDSKENVEAARTLLTTWKVVTSAFEGAFKKFLIIVFTGGLVAAAAHYGIKVSLGN